MKTQLFLATIFLMVVTGTLGGRIHAWGDPDVVFPNSGRVQYMNLYFQLDNKLPTGHVLRVTLPFATTLALNSSSTVGLSTIYTAASASKGTHLSTSSPTSTGTVTVAKFSSAAPYTVYYTFSADLVAATPYVLRLVFTTSPTDTGFVGYIQMETMSPATSITASGSDSAISYDLNNAFAPVQLFAAPGNITTWNITADANSLVGGQSSVRQLSFLPSQSFFYWPLIQLSWDSTSFTISNVTSIDNGVNTSSVTPLTFGSGTSNYWTSQNTTTLNIFHNQQLLTNQTVKYNFTTANPSGTTSQTIQFSLKIMHRYNLNLTDVSTTNVSFTIANTSAPSSSSTTTVTIPGVSILLSWGIDPAASTLTSNTYLTKVFQVMASPTTNPTYQAIRFVWGTVNTLASASYRVALTVCATSTNCDVLENSITTSFSTTACWTTVDSTARKIFCNTSSIATSGNYIAARIWYTGTAAGAANMLTAAAGYTGTTTFLNAVGAISITVPTNDSFTAISGSLNTTYNVINYNNAPLANINGNGPMAALPYATLNPTGTNYTALWSGSVTTLAVLTSTDSTGPTAFPTNAIGQGVGNLFGGIYGTTTANAKYHVALHTSGTMVTDTASYHNTFGIAGTGTGTTVSALQNPGIDIFMNPNIYSSAGTNNSITSCWSNNLPRGAAYSLSSAATAAVVASGTRSAHCFVNSVSTTNQSYFRLRQINTPEALTITIGAATASGVMGSIESVPASNKYLSFYWENAFQINSSFAGASLKADTMVNDFYGLTYTLAFAAAANNPKRSGDSASTDIGEISTSISNLAASNSILIGIPFFWSQPILLPYGVYTVATTTTTPYFKGVTAFINGLSIAPTTAYTTNNMINLIRIRGSLTSTSGTLDYGLYPTSSGKLAIFLQIPNAGAVWEPLGPVNQTSYAGGFNNYNTASGPLVGNGAVRCWNSGSLANCLHDRTGRAFPIAAYAYQPSTLDGTTGTANAIDLYQIISTDANYTTNFSVVIVVKSKAFADAATLKTYQYRLAFQSTSTGYYYIQPWDQYFQQATTNTSSVMTIGTYPTIAAAPTQFPASGVACQVAPFTSSTTNAPSIRLQPAATETDNTLVTTTPFLAQGWTAAVDPTAASAAKQGSFVWCVQWNFRQGAFSVGSNTLENSTTGDKCVGFDYLAYESSTHANWYCIYCPIVGVALQAPTGSPINITLNNFFTGPAVNIYNSSYHAIFGDTGLIIDTSNCPSITGNSSATNVSLWIPQTIATTSVSSSYNVSAQKVTIAFTAPSTLATSVVETIQIQGRNQSSAGTDSSFPYASLDSAAVCKLVPTSSVSNVSAYLGCTATLSSGLITITPGSNTVTGSNGFVTGWTVIIWGLNGNNYTATTLPNTTYFTITTYKGSNIVDQSNTTNTSYGVWSLSTSNGVYFNVPTIGYQRNIIGARGWFRFDLTFAQRPWFNTDKVVINLDAIVTSSVNANSSVVKCRITDTSDVISQIFQSCTLALTTTPPTVTIIAMPQSTVYAYEVALASSGVRVYLDNIVVLAQQTNKTVYGSITFLGSGAGTTSALTKLANTTDITPVNLTSNAFPTGYPTITKYWNNANDLQDLVFGLYTNTSFNSASRITIVFPSYYNPGLTTRSSHPYCTINNVYAQCVVGTVTTTGTVSLSQGLRQLVLYGASTSISNGTLVVRVNGISAPPAAYAIETFWIQINSANNDDSSSVIYCGAVSDAAYAAPSVAVLPLNVVWYGVSAATTRSFVTYTWSVYLNNATATLNTSTAVQVIFPESYGLAWGVFTPTCSVSDFTNSSVSYTSASTTSTFGNLVNMNVSTAIPAGSVFNITCSNVRTDNLDGYYRSQDVTIRVVDPNGTFVWYRAAAGQDNVNYTSAFAKGSSQTYVSWTTGSSEASAVPLTAGTYSALVIAAVPSKSSRSFTMTISNSQFAFLSSTAPFWIVTGATLNATRLGCAQSVPVGLYGLTFTISDNSSTYVAPPTMFVAVNTNAISIAPSSTTLSAFYSASSLTSTAPLTFDLTAYPPFSDITITPVAPTSNTNFTFTPSSIKITPAAPKAYFTWTSTSAATVAASAIYTFTVTGTNAASYTLSSSVTISLTTDSGTGSTNTPVLAVTADGTDTTAATSKVISFTLSQVTQANIYWVVTLQGQSITDATAIQMNAAALTAYNANSANQAQYTTYYQSTTTRSQTITNLFPNTGYTVTAVAVSNTNKSSTVASYTFVTGANSAVIQRWLFNYSTSTYPSQSQRQSLLCLLTQNLAVPAINVRNVHGEICGNTTAFYSATNSTGDLGVYFYPLQATTDITMTAAALQTALNGTTSNVLSSMNTTLSAGTSGIGWLSAFVDIASIRNAAPGITLPSSIPSTQLTTTSIYFSVTASNDTGFLFVTLASNSSSTPTAVAIKQAAANISSITGALSTQVFYFYPGATLSYNFTGLTAATTYNVYVVASNNDPSFLQNFTSVTAMSVSTPSTSSGTTSGQIGVIFSVMAVFVSVISLMFF